MLSADDLHDLRGAGASPYDSEMPTDLDGCIKESAHALGQPRVYDDTYLEMETSHASTPDPADFAVQGARHGQHLSSPAEACTMAGLLSRALIMFTCGVGGPWLSGLGIASCTVTKGLVLAAADAIAVGLEWKPGAQPVAVETACGMLDWREALAYLYLSPGGGEGTNHASRHPSPSGGPSSTGRRDT